MNRQTTLAYHTFDWTEFMPNKRPAVNRRFNASLFGFGLSFRDDQILRSRSFAIGADWLIKIAAGYAHDTNADHADQPVYMKPNPMVHQQRAYLELTLFTFSVSIGQENKGPFRLRYFLDGRRVFWNREASKVTA